MIKKRAIGIALIVLVIATMLLGFASCGCSDKEKDAAKTTKNASQEETDEPIVKLYTYEDFVGTWEAATAQGIDAYGGYEITFNDNKTFDAIVTGEAESGKCGFENNTLYLDSDILKNKFELDVDGNMTMYGDGFSIKMKQKAE